jgi:hypothetical protein
MATITRRLEPIASHNQVVPSTREDRRVDVTLFHEIGRHDSIAVLEQVEWLSPYPGRTAVHIRVQPTGDTRGVLSSPTYMAAIRRREASDIMKLIESLQTYAGVVDFTAYTFPVIEKIKTLLNRLSDAEREGNTREILRQLRNTFINGGWERYRISAARNTAIDVFRYLSNADEIVPEDVRRIFDELLNAGFEPVGVSLFDTTEEEPDVEEDEEVSG